MPKTGLNRLRSAMNDSSYARDQRDDEQDEELSGKSRLKRALGQETFEQTTTIKQKITPETKSNVTGKDRLKAAIANPQKTTTSGAETKPTHRSGKIDEVTEGMVRNASADYDQAQKDYFRSKVGTVGSHLAAMFAPQSSALKARQNVQKAEERQSTALAGLRSAQQQYNTLATKYQQDKEDRKYNSLRANPDFAFNSQGDEDMAKRALSRPAMSDYYQIYYRHANDLPQQAGQQVTYTPLGQALLSKDLMDGQRASAYTADNTLSFITDDEAAMYFYLWKTAKDGGKSAKEYLDSIRPQLNERRNRQQEGLTQLYAKEEPVKASMESVLQNQLGIAGVVDLTVQNARRYYADDLRPIDYNTPAQDFSKTAQRIRETVAKDLEDKYPGDTLFGISNLAAFAYQTGMSMADSTVQLILNQLGVPQAVTLSLMSGGAAQQAVYEAKERGADDGHALLTGYAAGIAEALFEKLSLDNMVENTIKTSGKTIGQKLVGEAATGKVHKFLQKLAANLIDIGIQGGVEGSEEVFTTLANTITDNLINQDLSELRSQITHLINTGVSEAEATKSVMFDWLKGLALDGLGGLVSGVGMGAPGAAYNTVYRGIEDYASGVAQDFSQAWKDTHQYTAAGKDIRGQGDIKALVQSGLRSDIPQANALAQDMLGKLAEGKNISNNDLGRLAVMLGTTTSTEAQENAPAQGAAAAEETERTEAPTASHGNVRTPDGGLIITAGTENAAAARQAVKNETETIVNQLRSNSADLMKMEPVAVITGNELPSGGRATDRAMEFLKSIGNKVTRSGLGEVLFSRSKVKTSLVGHGAGQAKIETIAAVPAVIQHGKQLSYIQDYDGRGYDTYLFGAPVTYRGSPVMVGVVVAKDRQSGRYYVHEVVDSDGNIIMQNESPESNADRPPVNTDAPVILSRPSGEKIAQSSRDVNAPVITTGQESGQGLTRANEEGKLVITAGTQNEQGVQNGQQSQTARAAGETAGRQGNDGGSKRSIDLVERGTTLQNFRANRQARRQQSEAARIRALAVASEERLKSAAEIGLRNGTLDETFRDIAEENMTRDMRETIAEYAKKGVKVHLISGLMRVQEPGGKAYSVRGWVSADGKEIWVQADNTHVSWKQLLVHEDTHRMLDHTPGLRDRLLEEIQNDEVLGTQFDAISKRYAEAYAPYNVTGRDVLDELLADYRAGIDITGAFASDTQKGIRERVQRGVEQAEETGETGGEERLSREINEEGETRGESNERTVGRAGTLNRNAREGDRGSLGRSAQNPRGGKQESWDSYSSDTRRRIEAEIDRRLDGIARDTRSLLDRIGNPYAIARTIWEQYQKNPASADTWANFIPDVYEMLDSISHIISENTQEETHTSTKDSTEKELSKGQIAYFKDSKIRDKDGNLLVLYHGTAGKFFVFDLALSGKNYGGWSEFGEGVYLTPDKKMAQYYADEAGRGKQINIMELYANITNPFNVMEPVSFEIDDLAEEYDLRPADVSYLRGYGDRLLRFLNEHKISIYDYLTSRGYDGVWDSYNGRMPTQVVAYTENQVKDVANENPTENVDIRLSREMEPEYNRTALLTEDTVDRWLKDYASKSSPKYAQAYVTRMTPDQFLRLTTSRTGRLAIEEQTQELDAAKLIAATRQNPLQLNISDGEVVGHEGRHRANALLRAGVKSIPVLVFDSSNKYSKQITPEMTLQGQDFGRTRSYATETLRDLTPLSYENRDKIVQDYGTQPATDRLQEKYNGRKTIKFSREITPEQDADYLSAVKSGDMETAQKMVDAAAKAAGYTTPRLYHGTRGFGFTVFDTSKSDDNISLFATSSPRTAETYSGETKRNRISNRSNINVDGLSGEQLLDAAKQHLNRYQDYRLMTRQDKEDIRKDARHDILATKKEAQTFINDHDGAFDLAKEAIMDRLTNALTRLASAGTEDTIEKAWDDWNEAVWDFKDMDDSLAVEFLDAIGSKSLFFAKNHLADLMNSGDMYMTGDADRYNYIFDNQLALELDAELHKGIYELFGKPGKQLVIDANGENWNQITPPDELNLYGPQRTRDIAAAAKANGYDSVLFKDLRDNGGETAYNGVSDVYIFFNGNDMKSADPVTYDDQGKEIPLSERFNPKNEDIRYSREITPAQDEEYMTAVNSGDMDAAQRMVDEAANAGGWTIHAYHGTGRADRVGTVFRPDRATSGPMAFFTSDKSVADNYAKSKQDTSLAYDTNYDSYEEQFRALTPKGANHPIDMRIAKAWGYIPFEERRTIREKAEQLRFDWDGDDDTAFILDPKNKEANGGFQWQIKEARGNVFQALVEQWLNSANLFDEEERFLDVLKMVGATDALKRVGLDIQYKDPNYREEKTYDVYIKMTRPFNTAKVNERFIENLEKWYDKQPYGKYDRESVGADLWDKNSVSVDDFAERLRNDLENNTTHAWTSIPDAVTDYLKHLKYDGIIDKGGKYSDLSHTVYIPFYSEQIKSTAAVTYDDHGGVIPLSERFNPEEKDIRRSIEMDPEEAARAERQKWDSLRQENEDLKKQVEKWKAQTKPSDRTQPREEDVRRMAKNLLKSYDSKADQGETIDALRELAHTVMSNDSRWTDVKDQATRLARTILENSEELVDAAEADFNREIRSAIRSQKISFSGQNEIPDYNEWRKANFGRLAISQDGLPVDSFWQELQDTYGKGYFPDDIMNPTDQVLYLADLWDRLQDKYYNPFSTDMAEATQYLANDLIDRVISGEMRQAPTTYADRANAKLARESLKWELRTEKVKARLEAEKERRKQDIADLKEHYKTKEAKSRESRQARELREKITKHARKMTEALLHPTDKRHIPDNLGKGVAAVLSAIDLGSGYSYTFDTNGDFKRVPRGLEIGAEETKRTQAFMAVREALLKEAEGLVMDPELLGTVEEPGALTRLVTELANIPIANMNSEQLQVVYNALRGVEGAVNSANKMLSNARWAAVSEAADAVRQENAGKTAPLELNGALGKARDLTQLDMLTPEAYFHRFGKAGDAIFKLLRSAQDAFTVNMKNAVDDTQRILGDTDTGALEKEKHTLTMDGQQVTMTTAQIMELYCLMQREQGLQHITTGGLMIEPTRNGLKKTTQAEPLRPSVDELYEAIKVLTPEQMHLVDELQKYLSEDMAELGNEATMKVYGYKKFGQEKKYWKIRSNKNEIASSIEKETQTTSVANRGFTKAINPQATTSVKIGSIFDTYSQSVNDMATYAAWLAVGEDVNRIRNYVFRDENGERAGTVKGILDRVIGSGGANYLQRLMADIANGAGMDDAGLTSGFVGAYKAAAIGANVRVIIQQPTAILRAAEMIAPKYLAAGLKNPMKAFERAKQYSPIAQWKDWGYFDINTGRKMKDVLFKNPSKLEKVRQASMALAGKADSFAWGQLWAAVEAETKDKTDLTPGTKEFYQACAERFNNIIDHTQVVDGILQRSQIMRSKNAITRMAVSFMSEPTKQYNQFMSAVYDYRHSKDKKAAKQMLARTTFSMLAAGVANVLAQSLIDALRDSDRDKKYWEKLLQAFLGYDPDDETFGEKFKTFVFSNMGEMLNPASYLPYAKDIMSIIQGYSVDRMDMDGLSDTITAMTRLYKSMHGEGKQTVGYSLIKLGEQASKLLGLPAYNLDRDITSLFTTIINDADMPVLQYYLNRYRYKPSASGNLSADLKGILWDAKQKDNESFDIIVDHMLRDGYEIETIDKAMRSMFADEIGFTAARKQADAAGNNNGSYDIKETLAAINDLDISSADRDSLLEDYLSDTQYAKYTALTKYANSAWRVDYRTWNAIMMVLPSSSSQDKITEVLDKQKGLTTDQKAALWQILSGTDKTKNNPYNKATGEEAVEALEKAKKKTGSSGGNKDRAPVNQSGLRLPPMPEPRRTQGSGLVVSAMPERSARQSGSGLVITAK